MFEGERIKKVRKAFDLTQQAFADKIGSKRNTVATYEMGRTEPSFAVISLICREFNVSETWLRTGEGEMFVQTAEDPVERLCAELHATELDAEIIRAYFKIDARIREPFMRQLLEQVQISAPAPPEPPPAEVDIASELAELKQQNQALAAEIAALKEEDAALAAAEERERSSRSR